MLRRQQAPCCGACRAHLHESRDPMGWTWLSPTRLDPRWWGQARDSLCAVPPLAWPSPIMGLISLRSSSWGLRTAGSSICVSCWHRTGPGDPLGTHMPEAAGTDAHWDGAVMSNPQSCLLHARIKANFTTWGEKKKKIPGIYMKGRLSSKP